MPLKDWLILALIAAMVGGGLYLRYHWIAEGADRQAQIDRQAAQEAADAWAARLAKAEDAATAARAAGAVRIAQTTAATDTAVRTITRIVHDSPAPAACVLPADSLRHLQDQVDAANAAASRLR